MKITGLVWLKDVIDKLAWKHHVTPAEVEEVFASRPRIEFAARGHYAGEDVYVASGQTEAGRYLVVFFVHKTNGEALILSARDMDTKERKRHGKR